MSFEFRIAPDIARKLISFRSKKLLITSVLFLRVNIAELRMPNTINSCSRSKNPLFLARGSTSAIIFELLMWIARESGQLV